jgi:hypothetical protein
MLPGMNDWADNGVNPYTVLDLGENERATTTHPTCVAFHYAKISSHNFRKISFVDDE